MHNEIPNRQKRKQMQDRKLHIILQWAKCNTTHTHTIFTAQIMKFSIKDFSSKCDQIGRRLRIWSHLLEESLMENTISV